MPSRFRRRAALDVWAYRHQVQPQFIQSGKPMENAFIESFTGRLRDECLQLHWFINLEDARRTIERWRIAYNTNRPHSGLHHHSPLSPSKLNYSRKVSHSHWQRGDPHSGRWHRPWVFRMTLCHSRHGYEEAVWDQKLETFLRLHQNAFADLGGVPRVVRHGRP